MTKIEKFKELQALMQELEVFTPSVWRAILITLSQTDMTTAKSLLETPTQEQVQQTVPLKVVERPLSTNIDYGCDTCPPIINRSVDSNRVSVLNTPKADPIGEQIEAVRKRFLVDGEIDIKALRDYAVELKLNPPPRINVEKVLKQVADAEKVGITNES